MDIITLTTDFGIGSHYIARVKGALYASLGNVPIVDISHDIKPWDIGQGVFLFSATRKSFKGRVFHIFGVNEFSRNHLVAKTENQWFIAPDNGALPEILKQEQPIYYSLGEFSHPSFLERLYPEVIKSIMDGNFPNEKTPHIQPQLKLFKIPAYNLNAMKVFFVYVDRFGNSVLNLRRDEFYSFVGKNQFKIMLNESDYISEISDSYYNKGSGELLAVFNSAGFLEIAVVSGNANTLFGLEKMNYVIINRQNND